MCGICGFVGSGSGELADLERMGSALTHRGPDDGGYHLETVTPAVGDAVRYTVGLGHRRLSIIDLSAAGHQPMFNEDKTVAMVFNGEIYNFRQLRRELSEQGHYFQSKTDSETVIHGYEEWGLGVLERLNGMFTIALWDRKKRRLILARDRIGIKPLYYYLGEDAVMFASELTALRQNPSFVPAIDRESIGLYLDFSYIPAPKTVYLDTFKLLPGEALVWEPGGVRTHRYWSLDTGAVDDNRQMTFGEAKERCAALIRDAVSMRLVSDVPLGAFLSGGYDSSLVVALMKAAGATDINTYSISFETSEYDEAPHARAVAEHLGTSHHEMVLTPEEAIRTISRLSAIFDEPFGDSSALPTYLVSKFARDSGLVVSLSGDGGDELFCGYNRYQTTSRLYRFAGIPGPIRRIGRELLHRSPSARWRKFATNLEFDSLVDLYHYRMSSWKGGNPYELVVPAAANDGDTSAPRRRLDAQAWAAALFDQTLFRGVFDRFAGRETSALLSMVDIHTYLVDDILTKVDRASMAVSLEVRVPLLDHRVVEFAAGLPAAYRMGGGNDRGKRLLKAIAHDYVPQRLLHRPKQGFAIPVASWLRGPLRALVEHTLDEDALDRGGLLDGRLVGAIVRDFLGGSNACARLVWSLLMLELWRKQSEPVQPTTLDEPTGDITDAIIENQGVHANSELRPVGRRG